MSNYFLSLHVDFAARKSSLKKSQRVADHIIVYRGGNLLINSYLSSILFAATEY